MDNDFVKKQIEQPIMDAQVRDRVNQPAAEANYAAFESGFYRTNKYYIWAVGAGLLIIGALAFFAFRPPSGPKERKANVSLEISAPEKIPSGSEAVYAIKLQNKDDQKLTEVRLELAYPEGITYISSVPKAENLSGTVFKIPDLISGQISPSVIIRAKVSGNVGENKQIVARMFYHFSNFDSEFAEEKAYSFTLSSADVAMELNGPSEVSNAQLVIYTIKYKNNSDKPITNSRIRANFPEGFVMAQSEPQVSLGSNIWELGTLNPGAQGQIQVQGTFKSSNPGESKTWNAEFLVFNSGDYNIQNSSQITTVISSLPLLVTQEISAGSGAAVKPGDTLNFDVTYQNNSSVAATGVNIVVTLGSRALDLSSVQAEGAQVNNNTIIWNASGVPNLEILNPSESGNLRFSVQVKNPAVKDSSTNLTVVSDIKIKSNESQTFFPGNQLTLKISSPSALFTSLSYVSGQLPPKVGQATVYKVRLSLTNSTNEYSDSLLTAFVPLGVVSFEPQSVSAAEVARVQFDPATGKLTWNIGVLSANAGKFSAAKALEFNLRVIPSQNQIGQSPQLLKNISFSAKDSFTLEKVELTGENITTQDVDGGYGNGTVGE